MEQTGKKRNLELIGIRENRTLGTIKILKEEKENKTVKKTIKFKRRLFEKGKYDDILYNVKAVNGKPLNEHVDTEFNRRKLLHESTFDYDDFSKGLLESFPNKTKSILVSARSGMMSDVRESIDEINSILEGNGCKEIYGKNHWNADWDNVVGVYIDLGKDSEETVIYDTIQESFFVVKKNYFILKRDSQYRIL
jgi:hypothetical protein